LGYYWEKYQENLPNGADYPTIYNHTFYPDMNAHTCVNGTDYPAWMASEKAYIRLYLYKNDPQGCCRYWFGKDSVDGCVTNIIQSTYIDWNSTQAATVPTVDKTEEYLKMWYPVLEESKCKKDGSMPPWMVNGACSEWYLFHTRQQCCAAFGFC